MREKDFLPRIPEMPNDDIEFKDTLDRGLLAVSPNKSEKEKTTTEVETKANPDKGRDIVEDGNSSNREITIPWDSFLQIYEHEPERFHEYIDSYREKYRTVIDISELQRLENLKQFLDKDSITRMHKESTASPLTGGSWKDAFSPRTWSKKKKQAELLHQEESIYAEASNKKSLPEDWTPVIASEYTEKRHHADGGYYHYYYDMHGNTYFMSPDGSYWAERLSTLYSDDFNLPKFEQINVGGERVTRMRFLAEGSHTIDAGMITAEDCQKIDPMPVADRNRSFMSGAL